MEQASGTAHSPESEAKSSYFNVTDLVFVLIAIVVGVLVIRLGAHTFTEGMHTEATKANGEKLAAWIEEAGKRREAGEPTGVPACDGEDAHWAGCRDALVAPDGPLAGMTNASLPGGPLFSSACDHNQLDSLGTFIIEKGLPKPPDGASLMYAAIADDEPTKDALPLRVAVCGRGYSQINVREVRF